MSLSVRTSVASEIELLDSVDTDVLALVVGPEDTNESMPVVVPPLSSSESVVPSPIELLSEVSVMPDVPVVTPPTVSSLPIPEGSVEATILEPD